MKSSLLALTRHYHGYVDELLLLHQEALLERDGAQAIAALALFADMLSLHLELEDGELFAAHEHCRERRWATLLYRKEHDKLRAMLAEVAARVQAWCERGCPRRELIALLDYQRSFKNVLEHHEQREEIALLPELDGQLPAAEQRRMLELLQRSWSQRESDQAEQLQRLRAALGCV